MSLYEHYPALYLCFRPICNRIFVAKLFVADDRLDWCTIASIIVLEVDVWSGAVSSLNEQETDRT